MQVGSKLVSSPQQLMKSYLGSPLAPWRGWYLVITLVGWLSFLPAAVHAAGPPGADSDGDGIPDSWEIAFGLNPLDSADALLDPDGDGISNLLEYYLGGNPNVADRSVLPVAGKTTDGLNLAVSFNRRTDHDGLLAEVQANTNLFSTNSWTTNVVTLQGVQNLGNSQERATYRSTNGLAGLSQEFLRVLLRRVQPLAGFTYQVIDDQHRHGQGAQVVDIDGDGDLDVVAAFSLTDAVYLYLNGGNTNGGGTGTNWSSVVISQGDAIVGMQVAVADYDGDGDLDVAAVGLFNRAQGFPSPGKVAWYENPGVVTNAWTPHVLAPSMDGARNLAAADFTGDGRPDLVVSCNLIGAAGNGVYWFGSGGTGAWTGPITIDAGLQQVESVLVQDVDADGVMDIIACGRDSGEIVWYKNNRTPGTTNSAPTFTKFVIASGVNRPYGLHLANLDADPALELIVTAGAGHGVAWYDPPANPTTTWTRTTVDAGFGLGDNVRIFADDFNRDGRIDIAISSQHDNELRWYRNDSGGVWTPLTIQAGYLGLTWLTGGDVNGDGRIDLLTSTYEFDFNNLTDRIAWWGNERIAP